ncbi:hypothetical protein K3495_g8395 [Podosphaera aphanis]|nr:hypothetical protein K3495_g8395 [Podosphaera aphanis]
MWRAAIEEELNSILSDKTWVEKIPPKRVNQVTSKWVFTVKMNSDGTVERFKVKLVARGFTQEYGVDFTETFAPTVQMATLRSFFVVVAAEDLGCRHFDIKNAFTESEIKEEIYMKAPKGIKVKNGCALKILRSLHGLKQSAKNWNLLLRNEMKKWGFNQSSADPCLFVQKEHGITALVYVYDIAVAAKSNKELIWFKLKICQRFTAEDLGEIEKILGIPITRNRKRRTLWLDQQQYLEKILNQFGMKDAKHKPVSTPCENYENIRPLTDDDEKIDPTEYSMRIGSFMYAMVYTQADIAFVLGRLSQFMRDPATHHEQTLRRMMRYVMSTVDLRLRYDPAGTLELVVYSDADYATDKSDRKSISGSVGLLGGAAIFWLRKNQKSVSTSTAEVEYVAMTVTAKQGQWISQILCDMGYPNYVAKNGFTIETRADNQGAIALVKNLHRHERSKHIAIPYHYVRDLH